MKHDLVVNGERVEVELDAGTSLLEVLRERLQLTGTKESCGRGECGACSVIVGGRPRLACIELACRVDEAVWTVEGLALEAEPFRESLARNGGSQCGFCTPGQVVTAVCLLRAGLPESDAELRRALDGNVCRCTGYAAIVASYSDLEVTP